MTTKLSSHPLQDQESNHAQVCDLSTEDCAQVAGGRFKLPFQRVSTDRLLTTPDGDPVDVYVDGVKINSVVTGFVHL